MSTTQEDQRTAAHLAALAVLALAAIVPLGVTLVWLFNLGCPQLWHLLAGPLALGVVIGLMARVLRSLGEDPTPGGRWDR